jgi:diaminopimelate epimerase
VADPAGVDVVSLGSALQTHFPAGVNVEFVSVSADGEATMRVFERGVGETLACGTGIAAVAAVVAEDLDHDEMVKVNVPGGQARVEFRDGVAWLMGPADYSFRGSVGER